MLGRLLARVRQAWRNFTETPADFQQLVGQMREGLELQADATAFAMVRADEKYDELQSELENYESLKREAESLMREGKEVLAQRAVTLQVQSQDKIERLQKEYQNLQSQAEQKVQSFKDRESTVRDRESQVPELIIEQRMAEMEERIQRSASKYLPGGTDARFNQAERELRIRNRQLANKQLLGSDPNAALDREIKSAVGQRKIDQAMAELRARITAGTGEVVDGEIINPAEEAKKLLQAPRYGGLVQHKSERETIPVSRRLK
jgi:phage shock protein A